MKALGGGGGSYSKTSTKAAPKPVPKPKAAAPQKPSHSQLMAQWEANGRDANGKLIKHVETKREWTKADIDRARAEKERAEELAASAQKPVLVEAGSADEGAEAITGRKAHEVARARMAALAEEIQRLSMEPKEDDRGEEEDGGADALREVAECRRSQLEELQMLEAMFVDELLVSDPAGVDALRTAVKALGEDVDGADGAALRAVAAAPPLEFSLQLTAEEPDGGELVACILLCVRLPRRYPTAADAPPALRVEDVMVADRAVLGHDKASLTTRAMLDSEAICAAMLQLAAEGPCIWEMTSWLTEHAFEHVTSRL